ncbi:MAG TPA: hypothetical protein PLT76_07060 [Candidatus Omnitrophota bacterium]|nr:hypothetical protein [Candidatus Omnitrophota bacterium]HQO58465.1 hypothetical protein [Candidatus Omnitrophota bacterium]HQP12040.1 hypothetical protein [Candidatus Omnitrophota bacterium]
MNAIRASWPKGFSPLRFCFCGGLIGGLLFLSPGCASVSRREQARGTPSAESREEALAAASAVLGAVSGQDVTEKDLKDFAQQVRKDKEAQSAVESIANTFDPGQPKIKYCPVCGKRYRFSMEECPVHHVPLKVLED